MISLLIRESIFGFIFWSLFQRFAPMLWFYPMNATKISGYEVFLLFLLSPVIGNKRLLSALQSNHYYEFLLVPMVMGLLSFHLPALYGLAFLSCSVSLSLLIYMKKLWTPSQFKKCLSFAGLLIGFLAFLVARVWFQSLVPVWHSGIANIVVFTISLLACVDDILEVLVPAKFSNYRYLSKPNEHVDKTCESHPDSTSISLAKKEEITCSTASQPVPEKRHLEQRTSDGWFTIGIGFGSLLYVTHALFGEVSVICRWAVVNIPDLSPEPISGGFLVLLSLCFGFFLSFWQPFLVENLAYRTSGCTGLLTLYYWPGYCGFFGGLGFAAYTASLWPYLFSKLLLQPPHKCMTTAIVVYMAEMLFSVWTVAYNFVPFGTFLRERTDVLIFFIYAAFAVSTFPGHSTLRKEDHLITMLSETRLLRSVKYAAALLLTIGLLGFACRLWSYNPLPPTPPEHSRRFKALIWTYHFGYDNHGSSNFRLAGNLLEDTGADVIALLETDTSKGFLGNNDVAVWMGARLNFFTDFGPSTKHHTWGIMLLSRYPIVQSKHHLLPSPHGELAPAISATVNISGHLVDFVTAHMGLEEDAFDRQLQSEYLADLLHKSGEYVIFLGYITSSPGSRDYMTLSEKGRVRDIDSSDVHRFCEYIMYRGLRRLGYARISHGDLSDTELQMAHFEVVDGLYADNFKTTTNESLVDLKDRFPSKFGGFKEDHNFEGHGYHMQTPKYFLPAY